MAILLRRGLDADRLTIIFQEGEIAYTTDTKKFYGGDGITLGGIEVGTTGATWGGIGGILSAQTDLQAALNAKFNNPTGTISQYLNGLGTPIAFPTIPAQYNPSAGTGISITGTYPTQTITNTAPDQTVALSAGTGIGVTGIYPNFTITNSLPSSGGTVTSVAALTLGTTGTDVSSTVATGTTTPVITLNIPTSSSTNRGALSATDWGTFNNKQAALVSGTNIKTINSTTLLGSGNIAVEPTIAAGTTVQYWRGDKTWATFPTIPTVTPSALTKTDDTNVTLTLGGTPSTALLQAVSITVGWTGTLADARIASAATWNAKQNAITTGTTAQYFRGDLSLATFPTIPTVGTWAALNYPTWVSGTPFVKMTAAGTFSLDTNTYLTTAVSSVAALTLGTTGTDLSSTVATGTTTPVITLNVPTASAANRGALSSADWTTFNNKLSTLTVGTTTLTSGTVGRVLFQGTGNVLQQNTNVNIGTTGNLLLGGVTDDTVNKLQILGGVAITGDLNINGGAYANADIGSNPHQLVTKEYVDNATAAGLHIHPPVRVRTATNLTATYTDGGTTPVITTIASNSILTSVGHGLVENDLIVFTTTTNGLIAGDTYFVFQVLSSSTFTVSLNLNGPAITTLTNGTGLTINSRANSGVGATLVNAGTQLALVIGTLTLAVNDRVLVINQSTSFQNGVYVVTSTGSPSTNWILTRSSDTNKYHNNDSNALGNGDYFFVNEGNPGASESYVVTTVGDIVFGTTGIVFTQFSAAPTYTGTAPVSVIGQVISMTPATTSVNGYLTNTDWNTFNGKQAALGFTPYNATNPSSFIALTALSSTATGLTYTNTTGVFSLTSGYVIPTTTEQSNWGTAYTNRITSLTTTGSSGAATLITNVLNIPTYTLAGLGGQASSTNLTSLSGLTFASTSFVKMTATGTFALDTNTYYLNSNPSGFTTNTGTVTTVSVTTANGISGSVATAGTTPAITLTLGAITPTSVNSVVLSGSATPTLAVTGTSSISGSNTGDNAINSLYSGLVSNATHTGDATGATALTVVALRNVTLPTLGVSAGNLRFTGTGTNTWILDTSTYLTANQSITVSGDVSGTGSTAITATLATITQSTGSTFAKITLDTKGRVTGNTTVVASDLNSTFGSQTANTVYAAPNGTAGTPAFRLLVAADIPALSYQASSTNLTSLSGLTFAATSFVKMTATGTFALDTNSYLTANQSITLSGDISGTGSTAITTAIGTNKVTNAMLAQVATSSFLGRVTAATGNVETLTGTQATTLLDVFSSTLKGLAPASGGGTTTFLRADGTWAAPSGGGTVTSVSVVSANGFTGTVATATTTPAITLTTSITGLLKGNGTSILAATAGTDYQAALTGTGFVKSTAGVISYDTNTYLTANQSITLSGDISGTGTTAITGTLATITQSTGANFVKITVDTKGRITGNTAVAASDLNTTFGSQTAATFLAAPAAAAGNPSFRAIVSTDIPTLNQSTSGSAASVSGTNTITNANLRQSSARSVIGNATNATANIADISTATADQVLLSTATTLAWGTVPTNGITNSAVTYAKIQNVSATNRLLGRSTTGAGVVEEITVGGDLSQAGSTFTIANAAVSLAKMANLTANSIIGNNTGVAAVPLALTGTQVTAMLDNFTSTTKGLVPLSGGGTTNFLRADGTWAAAGGGTGTVTSVSVVSANGFTGTVATATSTPAITLTTSINGLLKGNGTAISAATAGTDYLVSVGISNLTATGTPSATTYLRGDNTWATITAGGSPGGTTGQIQYNNASAFAGAAKTKIDANGNLNLALDTAPPVAATDTVTIFDLKVGGRNMLAIVGPSGVDNVLQTHIARNGVSWWSAAGNSTTIIATGNQALTNTGTATTANVATTNIQTRIKRLEYLVTTAATTAVAGFRAAANQWWLGNAVDSGGFHFICRFGPATGVSTTTSRMFVGMSSATAAPTDVNPSTLLQICGVGYDSADTNMQFMHNASLVTATKLDLGASFPVPTVDRTSMYELAMFIAPNSTTLYYTVTDLSTNATASGTVTTNLPPVNTLLAPRGYCSVGGTSSVIGIALGSLYIETDY